MALGKYKPTLNVQKWHSGILEMKGEVDTFPPNPTQKLAPIGSLLQIKT